MAVTILETIVDGYAEQLDDEALQRLGDMGLDEAFVARRRFGLIRDPLRTSHEQYRGQLVLPWMTVNRKTLSLRVDPFEHGPFIERRPFQVYNVTHAMPTLRSAQVVITTNLHSCLLLLRSGIRSVAVERWNPWLPLLTELFKNADAVLLNEGAPELTEEAQRSLTRSGGEWSALNLGRTMWEQMALEGVGPRQILEGHVHVDH